MLEGLMIWTGRTVPIPVIKAVETAYFVSTFENEHGERFVFTWNLQTDEALCWGEDWDWLPRKPLAEPKLLDVAVKTFPPLVQVLEGTITSTEEAFWVTSCDSVVSQLRLNRR